MLPNVEVNSFCSQFLQQDSPHGRAGSQYAVHVWQGWAVKGKGYTSLSDKFRCLSVYHAQDSEGSVRNRNTQKKRKFCGLMTAFYWYDQHTHVSHLYPGSPCMACTPPVTTTSAPSVLLPLPQNKIFISPLSSKCWLGPSPCFGKTYLMMLLLVWRRSSIRDVSHIILRHALDVFPFTVHTKSNLIDSWQVSTK